MNIDSQKTTRINYLEKRYGGSGKLRLVGVVVLFLAFALFLLTLLAHFTSLLEDKLVEEKGAGGAKEREHGV